MLSMIQFAKHVLTFNDKAL